MAIKYKIIEKPTPGVKDSNTGIKAPITVYTDTIDPVKFLQKLSEASRISEVDIIRCLYSLQKLLTVELKNGNIVQTGIIGTFAPIVKKGKGDSSKEVPEIFINYRADKEMKKEMKKADLEEVTFKLINLKL